MASKRIILKGDAIQKEADVETGQTVTPGMLLERATATTCQPHSVVNGGGASLWARERDLFGKDIDEVIAADDRVLMFTPYKGTEINAFLADTENVGVGDPLVSDGAGALKAAAGTAPDRVKAYALEAINNTTGDVVRIQVEAA